MKIKNINLEVNEETAKSLYNSCELLRDELECKFGKELFNKCRSQRVITTWKDIKTFEDACNYLGIDPDDITRGNNTSDELAYKKLKVITKALNENNWTPDFTNDNQKKWYPYFKVSSSGFGFSVASYFCAFTDTSCGSRLCVSTQEKADYFGRQFESLWEQFLMITKENICEKTEEIKDCIEKDFDYKSIKTFNDACNKLSLCHENLPDVSCIPTEFRKSIIAHYKLMIIFKAINNGWKPDWSDRNQYKYYPWFEISSSGFGFSNTCCNCGFTGAHCGSRLCVPSSDIAKYIGKQFEDLYKDFLL